MTQPHVPEVAAPVAATGAVRLPRVNLLPPEIAAAARFRRFQLAMVGAGVAAVVVVAGLGYNAHQGVSSAQSDLAAQQARATTLKSQLAGLQSVKDVYTQVAAKKAMLAQAMGPEIRWSYVMTDLSLKVPQNVWLTTMTATEQATPAAPGSAAATAGTATGIGTVTFAGTAFTHDDVATWLEMLAKERGFTNAYFTNSTKASLGARETVNFSSSVTITPAALSGRYTAVEG